jgi:hypothetical protein
MFKYHGIEVSLLGTILRSFYLGGGIGFGSIRSAVQDKNAPPSSNWSGGRDQISYLIAKTGFFVRLGTNSTLTFNATGYFKGPFVQPAVSCGLGFSIDIPMIRTGPEEIR